MFNSSINVKLKSLFDKMYLSRNLYDKLLTLINDTDEGDHSYSILVQKANTVVNSINTIIDDLEELQTYNTCIQNIKDRNELYNSNYDTTILALIHRYEQVIDTLINDLKPIRIATITSDKQYKTTVPVVTVGPYEITITPNMLGAFIPTDDYYAWNTISKNETVDPADIVLVGEDYSKIDPLNEDNSDSYTGGVLSKKLSHSPMIVDLLINVKNGGFSLSSVNSKTGEVYSRIEDEYESNVSIGDNDKFFDGVYKSVNGVITTKPKPGLLMIVHEREESSVSIRRHGEFKVNAPSKFYASITGFYNE